jgi:hypothetical protein
MLVFVAVYDRVATVFPLTGTELDLPDSVHAVVVL